MLRSPSGCLTLAGIASILAIGHAEAQTPPRARPVAKARLTLRTPPND